MASTAARLCPLHLSWRLPTFSCGNFGLKTKSLERMKGEKPLASSSETDTLVGLLGQAPSTLCSGNDPRSSVCDLLLVHLPHTQGHAAPILYAVWAEAGFLPEAELLNLRKISSDLDGHPVPVSPRDGQSPGPLPHLPALHKGEE